jgi:hypothetical protein
MFRIIPDDYIIVVDDFEPWQFRTKISQFNFFYSFEN